MAQTHPAPGRARKEVLRCAAHAAPASNGAPQIHATYVALVEAAAIVSTEPAVTFRSGRSFSASVSGTELIVKGAPEVVLPSCTDVASSSPHNIEHTVAELAAGGLRVIAVIRRQLILQQAQ
ncbi:hypothetical protein ABFA25_01105 [Mycobacterium lepromatosis]|uniref:hypothetical protein n=1 Tax=Mycobacterium lepromatosis TaxID=480418 RepID=UPI003D804CF0